MNASFHSKRKYIDVRYHWVRNVLENNSLELTKTHTFRNVVHMMTKVVTKEKYVYCRTGADMEGTSHAR